MRAPQAIGEIDSRADLQDSSRGLGIATGMANVALARRREIEISRQAENQTQRINQIQNGRLSSRTYIQNRRIDAGLVHRRNQKSCDIANVDEVT